jgi:hypothetical protein
MEKFELRSGSKTEVEQGLTAFDPNFLIFILSSEGQRWWNFDFNIWGATSGRKFDVNI